MHKKGFTLIELLVVIAIIGLLSSVVLASLNQARAKARDNQRKQTIIQVRNALELYYADNKSYPPTGYSSEYPSWFASDSNSGFSFAEPPDFVDAFQGDAYNYITELVPNYISKLSKDPNPGRSTMVYGDFNYCDGKNRSYVYGSDGKDYKLISYCAMETEKISESDSMADMVRCDGYCAAFGVWTDGSVDW
jgi:prepilin-type N-terminal cleavage/methylation domain-containing protein